MSRTVPPRRTAYLSRRSRPSRALDVAGPRLVLRRTVREMRAEALAA
ncbi:hypothetical protein [Pimelobacter simplex]